MRTREIGIRMALGARPGQVLRQVLWGGMLIALIGIAGGLAGAVWATSLLRTLLFSVDAHDPLVYAAVALAVMGVAVLANFVPARRAAAVDPMQALRFE